MVTITADWLIERVELDCGHFANVREGTTFQFCSWCGDSFKVVREETAELSAAVES